MVRWQVLRLNMARDPMAFGITRFNAGPWFTHALDTFNRVTSTPLPALATALFSVLPTNTRDTRGA